MFQGYTSKDEELLAIKSMKSPQKNWMISHKAANKLSYQTAKIANMSSTSAIGD